MCQRVKFADRVVVDPVSHDLISLVSALDKGIIDSVKGLYVDSTTGNRMMLEEAAEEGLITWNLLADLNSGLGISLARQGATSTFDAICSNIVDLKQGMITSIVNDRRLTFEDAVNGGVIDLETGKKLLELSSPLIVTTRIMSSIDTIPVENVNNTQKMEVDIGDHVRNGISREVPEKELQITGNVGQVDLDHRHEKFEAADRMDDGHFDDDMNQVPVTRRKDESDDQSRLQLPSTKVGEVQSNDDNDISQTGDAKKKLPERNSLADDKMSDLDTGLMTNSRDRLQEQNLNGRISDANSEESRFSDSKKKAQQTGEKEPKDLDAASAMFEDNLRQPDSQVKVQAGGEEDNSYEQNLAVADVENRFDTQDIKDEMSVADSQENLLEKDSKRQNVSWRY